MYVINIPEPNEKQKLFFADTHKYVAYGGARGGGKSWAVRVNALLMAARYPGITQMIIRRSYPELYANHIKPFMQLLPKGSYRYNDTRKEISLPNGSRIIFRYCANDADLLNFQPACGARQTEFQSAAASPAIRAASATSGSSAFLSTGITETERTRRSTASFRRECATTKR